MTSHNTDTVAIALLRQALGFSVEPLDTSLLEGLDQRQWHEIYRFTVRQFVTALVFDVVSSLPAELRPPRPVLLEWMVHADKVATQNEAMTGATLSLDSLMTGNGIGMIVLKGAGIAALYKKPHLREAADVDIYLGADFEKGDKVIRTLGGNVTDSLSAKHHEFIHNGTMFENHRTFTDSHLNRTEREVQAALERLLDEGGTRRLPVEGGAVTIPNARFNTLHVARHMATHFAGGVIFLRNLCDWAYMLRSGESSLESLRLDDKAEGFNAFMDALTAICIDRLGLPAVYGKGIRRDKELEERIYAQVLATDGKKSFTDKGTTPWSIIGYKIKIYRSRKWKHKLIFDEGTLKRFVNTTISVLRKPARILHR